MLPEIQSNALELPFALEMLGVVVGSMCGALAACARKLDIVGAARHLCGAGTPPQAEPRQVRALWWRGRIISLAGSQRDNLITAPDNLTVMRCQHDGPPGVREFPQDVHHHVPVFWVKGARWLVRKDYSSGLGKAAR